MVDEPTPLLPSAQETIEAETGAALEPEPESGEPTPEATSELGFVCDCVERMRSACKGLPFYNEQESRRYCVLHYPGKEKSADFKAALDSKLNSKDFDFRGVWFPDEVNFVDFDFGAPANFSEATFSADADFSVATLRVADFARATFSEDAVFDKTTFIADTSFAVTTFGANARFLAAKFSSDAHFLYATFSDGADFSEATFNAYADFTEATFSADAEFRSTIFAADAEFSEATFSADADFRTAKFTGEAGFSSVTFSADANFSYAMFRDADFYFSVFHGRAGFSGASFNDSIHFFGSASERQLTKDAIVAARTFGKDPSLDFHHVRIEHPDRMAFHTLNLRPHWFVNVDPRQFIFTDVSWEWDRISINKEIAALEAKMVSSPNRLLAIACRQLAENAEANNRYEEASNFRYWAMDLARRTKWKHWRFWKTDWLHMLYWAVSGYGERILRALGVLAAVWIVFVLLYTRVGFEQQPPKGSNDGASSATAASMTIEDRTGRPLEFSRALTYSLGVLSLQKPEPKPLTGTAQTLVLLETILGPVQAALLALAIRRKFMR